MRIGFEATYHNRENFKHFLVTPNLSFSEINPAFLKHYIQFDSNLISKRDRVYARAIRAISLYLSEKTFKLYCS